MDEGRTKKSVLVLAAASLAKLPVICFSCKFFVSL